MTRRRSPGQNPAATDPSADSVADIAATVAQAFVHRLYPAFRTPARLVCPSDAAEQAVIEAVVQASALREIPSEVIDLCSASAERLDAVTARLDGWTGPRAGDADTPPTLLILRGFDVFGDDVHDAPTYPFRSEFQFDRKFLWLFLGRDWRSMKWLFGSYKRPLYQAAGDITPPTWRTPGRPAADNALSVFSEEEKDRRTRQGLADVDAGRIISHEQLLRDVRSWGKKAPKT